MKLMMKKIFFYFHEDFAARKKAERDIEEARRHLERVEREYAETTVYKTTLEKEIATYRELLEGKSDFFSLFLELWIYLSGPSGLRRFADRVVQNAEQRALERPTTTYNYRVDSNKSSTRTIAHTYINTTNSNFSYPERISSPIRPPTSDSSTYQQIPTVISRTIPVYDETARHSSSSDSTIRGEDYYRTNAQEESAQNRSNRGSLIRERTPSPPPSSPSSSSSSSTSSSSSDGDDDQNQSSTHRNGANSHPPPPPPPPPPPSDATYEVLIDL